ncbi:MAG: ParB/Srx family N-terminal domain-containing protein [Pseudomonadota bacterium]
MLSPENIKTIKIAPDQVDLNNRDCYIPAFDPSDFLVMSIREVGILNPPLLKQTPEGLFIPILGRRRIEALRKIEASHSIEVRLAPSEMANDKAFLVAFWDNLDRIRLDAGVKAHVTSRLLDLFPIEKLARFVLPAINITARGPHLKRLKKIGRLEDHILKALSCGKINEKSAGLLAEMDFDQRKSLFELISLLGLNSNKTFELISNLFDLSVYWNESISDLLARAEARAVFDNTVISLAEKAALFRDLVRRWKFPEISRDREKFNKWIKGLNPPDNVSLRPSQSFEDDSVYVEIRVSSSLHVQELTELARRFQE